MFSHNEANVPESNTTLYFIQFPWWQHQGGELLSAIAGLLLIRLAFVT